MSGDLDRFVEDLQREIDEQTRQIYSAKVIEELNDPSNLGRMPEPDVCGLVHGWCGDTMEVFLRLDGEVISEASFVTDGCGPSVACGSALTKMIQGMSLAEAGEMRPEDLLRALDGLPDESAHCAELAVSTLHNALFNWSIPEGGPGKGRNAVEEPQR
jgi:nitrogen fixation NifU-like protein